MSDRHPELLLDPDVEDGPGRSHADPLLATLVALGGVAGTAVRYGIAQAAPTASGAWPVGTFVVNLVGAFVLGALLAGLARAGTDTGWRQRVRLLVGTGFCGGLTTYSTFAVESDLLVRSHATGTAIGYAAASLIGGLVAAAAGVAAAAAGHRAST